ncbi:MAG TPA: hypothetical protein VFY13_04040 [Luteolibacter sp.]|nr:hypothetical protein [Luteolibacter sp.]
MKSPLHHHWLLMLPLAFGLSSSAMAHPGHDTSLNSSAMTGEIFHFLTHIEHIGPLIMTVLLASIIFRRSSRSGAKH